MDKHHFDKTHTLRVFSIDDLDKIQKISVEYVEPNRTAYDEEVRTNPDDVTKHLLATGCILKRIDETLLCCLAED